MEILIVIAIISFAWLLIYLNKADTRFENANKLIGKKRFDEAQEILIKIASKHPLAVAKYADCFLMQAEELKMQGRKSYAILLYTKVLDAKKLLSKVSDKDEFNKTAQTAFYEISKLQFESILTNPNSLERINSLKSNLNFIKNSEFSSSNHIPKLIENHNEKICEIYFELGQKEEINKNFIEAKKYYSGALKFISVNNNTIQYFNLIGRIELCKLKLNENIELENIKFIEKSNETIRNDFYFRYSLRLIKNGKFEDAEKIIHSKLDLKISEIIKLNDLCLNEKIKSATNDIAIINNQINDIYNNTASINLLVNLYDFTTVRGNELNKLVPGILDDLEELKPSLLNRILQYYNEQKEYEKAINAIIKFPEFYHSPLLMKNLGNASFNFLKNNDLTTNNYKIIIALFLTSAYCDNVMLSSLEETQWDDEYTFSLVEAIGSNYQLHSEIPENVNYDEITGSNISIGEAQKYLVSEFEKLLNEKLNEYELHNKVFKFYQYEKHCLENVIQIIPNEIVFATPHFAKRFNIAGPILEELEYDYTEYDNEESLEAGIPYLNDSKHLWISDFNEAKKTIDSLINSINKIDISIFSNSLTESRKTLIFKFDSLAESMEFRLIDSLNSISKKHVADESVLDLLKKSLEFLPNNDKLRYMYSGYAANLCVTKINSDKMNIYKGLQIMSSVYKISPNDPRVCTNLIALIRMNILEILNQRSTNASGVYSLLDTIKVNHSETFKNNAGELLKTRNEILNKLPLDARNAIISGLNLNSNGRQIKKGLDYLAQLGGSSSIKDSLLNLALRERFGLDF